ncbi:hypothetical protein [Streptomyces sp. NPDC002851]
MDAGERADVPVCGARGAVFWKEDLDVDSGPKDPIGEASYAAAKGLGIDPDPVRGGRRTV